MGRFYFRAADRPYLDQMVAKILRVAEGAAQITGCRVEWRKNEYSNDNMIPNRTLSMVFMENAQKLGISMSAKCLESRGSSDMGNVSQMVPAIHPYLAVGSESVAHTRGFAEACHSEQAHQVILQAAKALAWTGLDLLTRPEVLAQAKLELSRQTSGEKQDIGS